MCCYDHFGCILDECDPYVWTYYLATTATQSLAVGCAALSSIVHTSVTFTAACRRVWRLDATHVSCDMQRISATRRLA